jgi:hypothetical protein
MPLQKESIGKRTGDATALPTTHVHMKKEPLGMISRALFFILLASFPDIRRTASLLPNTNIKINIMNDLIFYYNYSI